MTKEEFIEQFPEVKSVERVSLSANDTLVLTCPGQITNDTAQRLRDMLEKRFPGIKAIILADGLEVKVIRAE